MLSLDRFAPRFLLTQLKFRCRARQTPKERTAGSRLASNQRWQTSHRVQIIKTFRNGHYASFDQGFNWCEACSKGSSLNFLAINCRPKGNPLECVYNGSETAGQPTRLAITVKISARYIAMGSFIFSPILKAGDGDVGIIIKSQLEKISSVFLDRSCLTCCALVK